ncbi:MAG: hypothetical protein Fur0017_08280 [Anaerolineales bacterium]
MKKQSFFTLILTMTLLGLMISACDVGEEYEEDVFVEDGELDEQDSFSVPVDTGMQPTQSIECAPLATRLSQFILSLRI